MKLCLPSLIYGKICTFGRFSGVTALEQLPIDSQGTLVQFEFFGGGG